MRLCRFSQGNTDQIGFYDERGVIAITTACRRYEAVTQRRVSLLTSTQLLDFLPPDGRGFAAAREVAAWLAENLERIPSAERLEPTTIAILVPIARPNKIFLLAGNYAEHIREGGGIAADRAETFPYVFMKPPSTTLTHPGAPIRIPKSAPDAVDWELELAVVIGREAKHVSAAEALDCVAGYTIINDISQRKFRPNPGRKKREKDAFFDWLHGKWFDTFCPCGPCITSANAIPDPQNLRLTLTLNGQTKQDATTAQQVFSVAEVIAFISDMVTLEPGDLISTGTPAGVGNATGTFLKPGDIMHGTIEHIGTLITPVTTE